MKKVGILTEHRARNYGSCLQAYALQRTISEMGYETQIVDYRPKAIEETFGVFIVSLFREAKSSVSSLVKFFINFIVLSPFRITREINFYHFRKNKFSLTACRFPCFTEKVKQELNHDMYVCGSDQIWNPVITQGLDPMYFANPLNEKASTMSYAASVGIRDISKYEDDFRKLLNGLDKITVREESAKEILAPLTEKEISVVLDPTLLLTKNDWCSLFNKKERPSYKYILVYSLKVNEEMIAYAKKLGEEKGLPIVFFDLRKRYGKDSISKYTADPIDFIYYLYHADYVVTNSFHGTVFSVIFEKQFACIPMQGTSSRMTDLLKKIQLEDRIYEEGFDIDQSIRYEEAKLIMEKERLESKGLLKDALERGCFE